MMSTAITLSGSGSFLSANFFPPIELNDQYEYECALIDFQSFYSIPNVDETMNAIHIGDKEIIIPTGTYEVEAINEYIKNQLKESIAFNISINKNTLHTQIESSQPIDFMRGNTIAPILGFANKKIEANKIITSDKPVNISRVNVIRIECDIIHGSYLNNIKTHTLHEFFPRVAAGYKIIEAPQNIIYFPTTKTTFDSITLSFLDQNHKQINFRGEIITARIHIKRIEQ